MALKRVRTLLRMIADSGRLVCVSTLLTFPAALRSSTSAAVRPVLGVAEVGAGAPGALVALDALVALVALGALGAPDPPGVVGADGLGPTKA
jgi:hypothetical protein